MNKPHDIFKMMVAIFATIIGILLAIYFVAHEDLEGATVEVNAVYVYGRACTDWDSLRAILSWQGVVEKDTLFASACSLRALVGVDSVGNYGLKMIYYLSDGILIENDQVSSWYSPILVNMPVDSAPIARSVFDDDVNARADRTIGVVDSTVKTDTLLTGVGATATVDDSAIAAAVWNDDYIPEASRTIGNVSGLGSGGTPCTTFVMDSTLGAIASVSVSLYGTDGTRYTNWTTDANGRIIFSTAADTYLGYAEERWLTQYTLPDTIAVTAGNGANDTIWVKTFDPGAAPAPGLCRVYGYVASLSAIAVGAWVEAEADSDEIYYDGMVISHYARRDTCSVTTGYWYLDLFPSDSINSTYTVRIKYGIQSIRTFEAVTVPDSTQWWFTE